MYYIQFDVFIKHINDQHILKIKLYFKNNLKIDR